MKVESHPALDVDAVADFMVVLRRQQGVGARALEFAILTAARSGEVRGATWDEIDLDAAVWTIPGPRMKSGKEHRVPLSPAAVDLLRKLPRIAGTDLVFPAPRGSGVLSDMTLSALMRRMGFKDKAGVLAVPHGLRSTFRDWAADRTHYPREIAEAALAHTIENKTEGAYLRSDMFEKRRRMMADWGAVHRNADQCRRQRRSDEAKAGSGMSAMPLQASPWYSRVTSSRGGSRYLQVMSPYG